MLRNCAPIDAVPRRLPHRRSFQRIQKMGLEDLGLEAPVRVPISKFLSRPRASPDSAPSCSSKIMWLSFLCNASSAAEDL